MFSRRNARLKLVLALYQEEMIQGRSINNDNISAERLTQILDEYFTNAEYMLCYLIDLLYQISHYAYHDIEYQKALKKNKFEHPQHALNTLTKKEIQPPILATNALLQNLHQDMKAFLNKNKHYKCTFLRDEDAIKRLFYTLKKRDAYITYQSLPERTQEHDATILLYILEELLIQDEFVEDDLESKYITAYEDISSVYKHLKKYLLETYKTHSSIFEGTRENTEYCYMMAKTLGKHLHDCYRLIYPKIKNWEEERVCIIDKILLRLGICEFLYCDNIPVRVTIDEYIEIAKEYSTDKSKGFINGILDALLKDLLKANKIHNDKL